MRIFFKKRSNEFLGEGSPKNSTLWMWIDCLFCTQPFLHLECVVVGFGMCFVHVCSVISFVGRLMSNSLLIALVWRHFCVQYSFVSVQNKLLHLMISHVDRNVTHPLFCALDGRVAAGCFLVCLCGTQGLVGPREAVSVSVSLGQCQSSDKAEIRNCNAMMK